MMNRFLNKNILTILTSFFLLIFLSGQYSQAQTKMDWVKKVGSRKVPSKTRLFKVNAYGASKDGKALNTKAIQKAIVPVQVVVVEL